MRFEYSIHTPAGSFGAYIARPATVPAPVVVVAHEEFGVNADMRARCDELAEHGFLAVCPDLYWRQKREVDLSEKDAAKALALSEMMDVDATARDVRATVRMMRASHVCSGRVGVLGYGPGALVTYLAALRGGVDAGVCFYGSRTEEYLAEASMLDRPLLVHLAELDEWIRPEAQAAIRRELVAKGSEIHIYPGCHHAFSRHEGPHFNGDAASLASTRTIAFFERHLGAPAPDTSSQLQNLSA